jgi:hypothetical protein
MCTIKGDDLTPVSRRLLSLAHQYCLSPPQNHMAAVTPLIRGQSVIFRVSKESPTTIDL